MEKQSRKSVRLRITSMFMIVTMLMTMLSAGVTVSAVQSTQNQNQSDGVILKKTAMPKGDGTVDIEIDAYTTGTVISQATTTPVDIVLVLDVSGSMDNNYNTYRYTYEAAYGTSYEDGYYGYNRKTYYGFRTSYISSSVYYIETDEETYAQVNRIGSDSGNFIYYSYTDNNGNTQYVYPIMDSSITDYDGNVREFDYEQVQFYSREQELIESRPKIDALKESVGTFIDHTLAMNQSVSDDSQKHRIAIVKYADNSYYSGSGSLTDITAAANAVEGNNFTGSYNYTQLVKNFTTVDTNGSNTLKTAVESLKAGGATSVDYGVRMAQATLNKRSTADKASRSEVVIVFSDGEPNHSSGYVESVANTALEEALALKDAGVLFYTLSIFTNADGSQLGDDNTNKFMHYLSSNYPDAESMDNPGDGTPASGYYMTPNEEQNLTGIFEMIMQNIGVPKVTLGDDTIVADALSPYFDLNYDIDSGAVSSIKLETIKKIGPASGGESSYVLEPADPSITVQIDEDNRSGNSTIMVSGFDFDANYISDTPRNDNFYGRVLRITINVKPDYNAIDGINPRVAEIPTNLEIGPAQIISAGKTVAQTVSPTVTLNKVSYKVDGVSFDEGEQDVYRLPGSKGNTVINAPTKEGHTFSGWKYNGESVTVFDMPSQDIVIEGTFTPNKYSVTYEYTGTVPSGVKLEDNTELSSHNRTDVTYGTQYNITAKPAAPAGYTFSGWSSGGVTIADGKFTMPASDVKLVGSFTANGDTPYKIEHYIEKLEGGYELKETENETGKTDSAVTATQHYYPGFTFDSSNANNITSGIISGDGSLILKLYYNRNSFDVEYKYEGTVPEAANAKLPEKQQNVPYGKSVAVADDPQIAGYTFSGWSSSDVSVSNKSFDMPNKKVTFVGSFSANSDTEYKVEYYLQNIEDEDYTLDTEESYIGHGTTNTTATATKKIFAGFTFDEDNALNVLSGTIAGDGSLVLKLYYNRNKYRITYAYEGVLNPDDENAYLPAEQTDVPYGKIVEVESIPHIDGYDFVGWASQQVTATAGKFTMPANNVEFKGYFVAHEGIPYIIERYLENADGYYADHYTHGETLQDNYVKTDKGEIYVEVHKGTHGDSVFASRRSFEGFVYDADTTKTNQIDNVHIVTEGENAGMLTGTIDETNTLILRVYYKRQTYKATYVYTDTIPNGANELLPKAVENVRFGSTFEIADDINLAGYDFAGWVSSGGTVGADTESFTMPNRNVELRGSFIPKTNTKYTVLHIGEGLDGVYDEDLGSETKYGTTGTTVTATPKTVEGFTYNDERTGDEDTGVIVGYDDESDMLVLKVYYSRDKHKIEYIYTGAEIAGRPALPETRENVPYGEKITIADKAELTGYTFIGWTSKHNTIVNNVPREFNMPDADVQLRGEFKANTDTKYTVEHWIQNKDKTEYVRYDEKTQILAGTTDTSVTAQPIDITGYIFNSEKTGDENKGTIKGDGSLVLKLYYDRNEYKVDYSYTGTVPKNAPVPPVTAYYIQGETVQIESVLLNGYNFIGWRSYGNTVKAGDTAFEMPGRDVQLLGYFEPKDTKYKVEHYHQTQGGGTEYTLIETEEFDSKVGNEAIGSPKTYKGYNFNLEKSEDTYKNKVLPDGELILKLYYDKIPHTVSYTYYGVQPMEITTLPELPETTTQYLGNEVGIEQIPDVPDGYIFQGWYSSQVEVVPTDSKFTMPDNDVILMGRIIPKTDTPYKVEHYIGSSDSMDGYTLHLTEDFTGTTSAVAQAVPLEISGYTYYPEHPYSLCEGIIIGNPEEMLVLKLFYKRNSSGGGSGGTSYGTLEIKKTVTASDDINADSMSFEFSVYKGTSGKGAKYKTVTVKGNSSETIRISVGTYYVVENDAEVSGYALKTVCSISDNTVKISKNKTTEISFENIYTLKESMLEKNNHFAYIVGYPDGDVRPNASITRAEVATIFFRMMTDEARESYRMTSNSFSDVAKSDWHNIAISTLQNAKIIDGYHDGTFRPDSPITRAELSKIAASFYKAQEDKTVNFTDISGHWAENFIKSARGYGFIDGYPDGSFKPDQLITRAETMKIVNRSLERTPHKDYLLEDMIKWPDNADKNEWYYADVQEATNSHDYNKNENYEVWTNILPVRDWKSIEIAQ